MLLPLLLVLVALCLALAAWALVFVVRDRAVVLRQLVGAAVVEAVLVIQAVVAAVLITTRDHAVDGPLFWGYTATALLLLPVAAAWAFAERTKWSSVVLMVAALTVAFLNFRLWQIWGAA
ncbi:hypothetical protein Xcel_2028 [Xylanimonas cellulosilytica DSM 15894]|uniref:Integral membrane protein n=1 Tax=Xylanimonas cellulosilytica (strain DSM 15894 / JCM 12276 / CECT 5975 / KCTC 9989 / LMG 20990 / NBRC 107835 / XIL07) TaxID=446471 RepID=D1BTR8_XYLCX|nr:hypothetical protein [Xylanimonas cellulosilytica]ACZ31047.1 hypothetical protein Xcel_2028 [Xylanimonas cellulosilytica DSM 15894]